MGIVRSVFRHLWKVNLAGAGRPFEAGWMGNHWGGIKTSAVHQLSRGPPMANARSRRWQARYGL